MTRYVLMLVLFVAAAGVPSRFARSASVAEPEAAAAVAVPDPVRIAAEQGRYWLASRLMDRHLAAVSDTTEAEILHAARLSAGWGDWTRAVGLLEGREWLDRVERGAGWEVLGRGRIGLGRAEEGAEALARYLDAGDHTDREAGVTETRRGLALEQAGETAAALVAFDRARRLIPWFADWASLFTAEAAAEVGDTTRVRVELARTGALADDAGWRIRMRANRLAGDSMAAREIAVEVARTAPSAARRAAAWAELGALRLAAADTARARTAFLEAMEVPGAIAAVDAARALTELGPQPNEWRRIGDIYARHGNASRAAEAYATYLASGAATPGDRDRVRLELGRARFNAGRYDLAERELRQLASEAVPPRIGAEALYLVGRAQYRQGRSEDGQRTLAALPERFPGQEAVTRGLYLLADLKHDDLELTEARRYYREATEAAPHRAEAGLALMRLGGLAMLEGDHEEAIAIYEEYRRLHPEGRRWAQSTYWAARAYREMGREEESLARLRELRSEAPFSYYGVRAGSLLGEGVLAVVTDPAPAAESSSSGTLHGALQDGLRRVDVLADLGLRDELVREVERLREALRGDEPAEYGLAEALIERGFTLTSIGMGWDLYRGAGEWNPRLLRIVYPFPYREMVLAEARERELDPYLVAGLIRQESAFSPTVTSGAGAMGLMQVMPATGRALARETALESFEPSLLMQPEINVHLGTLYLATMLDRFEHDLPLVLSAYNAGPTRAARWRELPEARDPELFTDRVPYGETRDYIRHVVRNRVLYEALYPELAGTER